MRRQHLPPEPTTPPTQPPPKPSDARTSVLHLIPRDTRTELWIAAGMKHPYRVTSDRLTYGEFDLLDDARAFLALLLLGNPERFRGIGE